MNAIELGPLVEVPVLSAIGSDEAGDSVSKVPRVLIVDDELAGMDRVHLRDLEPDSEALLGDSSSPEVDEIISIASSFMDVSAFDSDETKKAAFLASDELVGVILSVEFDARAGADLKKNFANFLSRASRVRQLREQFVTAFPADKFVLFFEKERVDAKEAIRFDLVVLDLVLRGSGDVVGDLVSYLRGFSSVAGDEKLPPIIVMSTHTALTEHRRTFSRKASISAAGLWILPKTDLLSNDFKAEGLALLFEQLVRQSAIAHQMRIFLRSWTGALETAREDAAATLWNLDASAMQRIHHTAIRDNDPYDAHLSELIAREYLWHVESDKAVSDAVKALDKCFFDEINPTDLNKLDYRFMAPFVATGVARELFSRFTWHGWPTAQAFFGPSVSNLLSEFNTRVPFGSVLASDLADGKECLVHVTQQCDLNAATRPTPEQRSAIFATALVHESFPHRLTKFNSQDLVARGLHANGKQFDLKFVQGRTIAMPIPDFLGKAEKENLKIFGRLRFDIANHFVQATANQLTRPASFVMSPESSFEVKLFLRGSKFPVKQHVAFLNDQSEERVVRVVRDGSSLCFRDDDSVRIAIWLERQMASHYANGSTNLASLSNTLRLGQTLKKSIMPNVKFDLYFGDLAKPLSAVTGIKVDDGTVILAIVADESIRDV